MMLPLASKVVRTWMPGLLVRRGFDGDDADGKEYCWEAQPRLPGVGRVSAVKEPEPSRQPLPPAVRYPAPPGAKLEPSGCVTLVSRGTETWKVPFPFFWIGSLTGQPRRMVCCW